MNIKTLKTQANTNWLDEKSVICIQRLFPGVLTDGEMSAQRRTSLFSNQFDGVWKVKESRERDSALVPDFKYSITVHLSVKYL